MGLIANALIASLVAAGAQHAEPAPAPDGSLPRPSELTLPVSSPENTEENPDLISALDTAFDRFAFRAPAWSVTVQSHDVSWSRTSGASDTALFPAASITKSMTAAVIFQLIEEGELSLTDTLDSWYPDAPNASDVSIDHLLTHRSGLNPTEQTPMPDLAPQVGEPLPSGVEGRFRPGTGWEYSNLGYALLGRIIEAVEGAPLDQVFQDRLFEPLGLDGTCLAASGTPTDELVPGQVSGEPVQDVNYADAYAAGGLLSNSADLVTWWRALLAGDVVSPASLEIMAQDGWPLFGDTTMLYARGLQVGVSEPGPGAMIAHFGSIEGFSSTVAWLPDHQVFVSVIAADQAVPSQAAMWALIQALDEARGEN
jgi:D-alanyl-D-alanine carboxypeptidase